MTRSTRREFTKADKAAMNKRALDKRNSTMFGGMKKPTRGKGLRWLESVFGEQRHDECRDWPFSQKGNGYGQIAVNYHKTTPHRVICLWEYGEPPSEKYHAAHSCGNRICCNPRHLRWATAKENIADKIKDGTQTSGDTCPVSKLNSAQVIKIKKLISTGDHTLSQIGRDFEVSLGTIWDIKAGKTWRSVG